MQKPLGGERLATGKKMMVDMRTYNRSTHNLSTIFRGSIAPGVLTPVYSKPAQNGDTWDGHIQVILNTLPTVGPVFGTFDFGIYVFCTPIRIYNRDLMINKLNTGLAMNTVKLPQIEYKTSAVAYADIQDNQQINASSLAKYMGVSGLGTASDSYTPGDEVTRQFNAIPILAYYDIFKNYFANKQETDAYVIHTGDLFPFEIDTIVGSTTTTLNRTPAVSTIITAAGMQIQLNYAEAVNNAIRNNVQNIIINTTAGPQRLIDIFTSAPNIGTNTITYFLDDPAQEGITMKSWTGENGQGIRLLDFPLANIDKMRENLMAQAGNITYVINQDSDAPYGLPMESYTGDGDITKYAVQSPMEGLVVATYKNDMNQNWVKTETQDMITQASSVSTLAGLFTMDQLNLADKVYQYLNRIMVSGGSVDDWEETTYTSGVFRKATNPMYMGGLIKEINFNQVVSTAATPDEPLGQLAGRGNFGSKHKGGQVRIKPNEWSYITAVCLIRPNIDYSQGNEWDSRLQTMDDFHKPVFDQIGFQDLITEQLAWFDTFIGTDGTTTTRSAGKQPAWTNYMTDVNRVYGNFAEPLNEMFMVLNRRYEIDTAAGGIKDLTTYIDPVKYNYIFAETKLDAQNFWVQIGFNWEVRRVISAKVMPQI